MDPGSDSSNVPPRAGFLAAGPPVFLPGYRLFSGWCYHQLARLDKPDHVNRKNCQS